MITDKDIQKLKAVFPTKEDHTLLVQDHVSLEKKVDELAEKMNTIDDKLSQIPTRTDMEQMLERSPAITIIKAEQEQIKQVIKEKLQVEI